MGIVLNPTTEAHLSAMKQMTPHAILLTGKPGAGLTTAAKYLSGNDLTVVIQPLNSSEEVDLDTGTMSVSAIRKLYEQTRSKSAFRQVFLLDSADRMSLGAQAAFLKLLEEPTDSTYFILTSHTPQALLPTIHSRVQTVIIEPLSDNQTKAFIDELGVKDQQTKKQLEYLASGLPAELMRLTQNETYFKERAEIMTDTRTFLTGTLYDKLLIVHKYHQNRAKSLQLIGSALSVTRRSLTMKPQPNLIAKLDALLATHEKISTNCNIRLQLMALVV